MKLSYRIVMAKNKQKNSSSENSWRRIEQSGLQGVSPQSKKRRSLLLLKKLIFVFIASAFVVLIVSSVFFYRKNSFSNLFVPVIKYVHIESDGALKDAQLLPFINLKKDTGIMSVDIFALKKRIETLGQVRSAIVARQFPDTLKITISEYKPIVKVLGVDEYGKRQGLLVSDDGHVFRAYGYTAKKLRHLPYLTGISLRKSGNSFKTISHMDCLSELLRCAQLESPHLYKYWKSVSLEYCQHGNTSLGAFIEVQTKNIGEIIFATDRFGLQLNRLNSIVSYASKQKLSTIERIDLSLGSQAAVKVASTP